MVAKLLYIHPVGLEGADMEQRTDVARSLGFDVMSMPNEPAFDPVIEDELAQYVLDPECQGVWADVEADQLGSPARRLVVAAGMADKRLLGRQRTVADMVSNFVAIIGVPEPEPDQPVSTEMNSENNEQQMKEEGDR